MWLQSKKTATRSGILPYLKIAVRGILLFQLLATGFAHANDDNIVQRSAAHAPAALHVWDVVGPGVIVVEFLLGFAWYRFCLHTDMGVYLCAPLVLHIPVQFTPIAVYHWRTEWVNCHTGFWWPVPWAYTLLLVLAVPGMTNPFVTKEKLKLPCVHWTPSNSIIASLYQYTSACVNGSDQYLDSMAVAIALQCRWSLAPLMLWILCFGVLLQAICGAYFFGVGGVLFSLGGAHIDSVATDEKDENQSFAAGQGVAKLITENVPQSILAVRFALDKKTSYTVWISITLSLALAAKGFVRGEQYFRTKKDSSSALE